MLAAFTAPGEELGSPKKRRKAGNLSDKQEELALEAVGSLGDSLPRLVAPPSLPPPPTCSSSLHQASSWVLLPSRRARSSLIEVWLGGVNAMAYVDGHYSCAESGIGVTVLVAGKLGCLRSETPCLP